MNSWEKDHRWAAIFDRQIKMAIGPYVIGNATVEDDRERATDLVLVTDRVRIACRIRRWSKDYFDRYGGQFTVRSGRGSGAKTELAKIKEGWGDLFFYGWGDPQTKRLQSWWLLDLGIFRAWHAQAAADGKCIVAGRIRNNDGSIGEAYWIDMLPEGGTVACGVGLQILDDSLVNI
jgi:hypothetical protein